MKLHSTEHVLLVVATIALALIVADAVYADLRRTLRSYRRVRQENRFTRAFRTGHLAGYGSFFAHQVSPPRFRDKRSKHARKVAS